VWPRRRSARRALTFYLLISPWLLGFVLLGILPLALGLAMSFTDYDGLNLDYLRFVGLENYAEALGDDDAIYALQRTLLFMAMVVPLGVALQLGLAFLLNQPIHARGIFRTLFYLPSIIPVVGVVWIWKTLAAPFGLLNLALGTVQPEAYTNWLVEHPTEVLTAMTIWATAGGGMVIFLAGLQGVPQEYREAAMIDGASPVQVTRFITLPLLTPVILFQLVLGVIGAVQILVPPLLLAPGASGAGTGLGALPPRANYFYTVHAYTEIFARQQFGYGAALLWILFVIVLVLTLLILRTSRRWTHYEVAQ
jgi:multiple sugar transport system permease protein